MKGTRLILVALVAVIIAVVMLACSSSTAPLPTYAYGACSESADSIQRVRGVPPVIIDYIDHPNIITWQYPHPDEDDKNEKLDIDFTWADHICVMRQYIMR